jgi:hypothetical protein
MKAAQLKDAVTDKAAQLKDAVTDKAAQLKDAATDRTTGVEEGTGNEARHQVNTHSTGHVAEATAQTSTRMVCSVADAAEGAIEAIGSARRRVTANPKQYALLGVAVAMAAAGYALIRRSR